jgi:hypothetical protein
MSKVEQVLEQLRQRLPKYDAYSKVYDEIEEYFANHTDMSYPVDIYLEIYADEFGNLLKEAIDADLVWEDDTEPVLVCVADMGDDGYVFDLHTRIDFWSARPSKALEKVRRSSEVGLPANAKDFDWGQYEVSLFFEVDDE